MDKNSYGSKLRQLRLNSDFSKASVYMSLGITEKELENYESGTILPKPEMLQRLCEMYNIQPSELEDEDFIQVRKTKDKLNIVQFILSLSMFFVLALPFHRVYDVYHEIYYYGSGFHRLIEGNNNLIWIVTLLMIGQLIYFILLISNILKHSNIFKTIMILFNAFILLFVFFDQYYNQSYWLPFILFNVISIGNIVISLFDIAKYPLEHDFTVDLFKMRRIFITLEVIVFACLFVFVMIMGGWPPDNAGSWMLLIVWAMYILSYPFLKKEFYESRIKTSIMTLIPTVGFLVAYSVYLITEPGDGLDSQTIAIAFVMLLPFVIINGDFFIKNLKPTKW